MPTPAFAAFEGAMGALDYPMFIVTARAGERRGGCLVGFATQTSIDPQRFLVCLSRRNRTFRVAQAGEHLAVHLVPEDAMELATLFGGETGDDCDKLARCAWHDGPEGLPILDACGSWFAGRTVERLDLGDHAGFLLAPFAAADAGEGPLLGFARAKRIDAGHEA